MIEHVRTIRKDYSCQIIRSADTMGDEYSFIIGKE